MRLMKRPELMTMPAGTLFAELHQEWVFGGLQLKGDTFQINGENFDFWVRQIDWPDNQDTGEAIDRLEEMAQDSTISYPIESAYGRHGLYDDERLYLVYEPADTQALIADLTQGQI
jgi:hypothetical protein